MLQSSALWALAPLGALVLALTPSPSAATPNEVVTASPPTFDGCQGCVPLGEEPVVDGFWYENGAYVYTAGFPSAGHCMGALDGDGNVVCYGSECKIDIEANIHLFYGYYEIWECGFVVDGEERINCKQPPGFVDDNGDYTNSESYTIPCGVEKRFWLLLHDMELGFNVACSSCDL